MRYKSNNGRGPMIAEEIARTSAGIVKMRRKTNAKSRRWVYFELPVKFLSSPACGWKRDAKA